MKSAAADDLAISTETDPAPDGRKQSADIRLKVKSSKRALNWKTRRSRQG